MWEPYEDSILVFIVPFVPKGKSDTYNRIVRETVILMNQACFDMDYPNLCTVSVGEVPIDREIIECSFVDLDKEHMKTVLYDYYGVDAFLVSVRGKKSREFVSSQIPKIPFGADCAILVILPDDSG